jgi:citrate synthase
MAEKGKIITALGKAEERRILVRGHDLVEELLGKITFTEMTWLMLAGRKPTAEEARMIDALLVILVEHGMVSSVVAARLTYGTAPEALQGAVAASLLGAGSVHLGSSEYAAKWLVDALAGGKGDGDLNEIARKVVDDHAQQKKRIAGIGHRTHPHGDPRAVKLFEIARETKVYGRYSELIERVTRFRPTSPAPLRQLRWIWACRGN